MASDEELRQYADSLPAIYREILAAFPRIEPHRRQGYGLAFQTLAADFADRHINYGLGEVIQACEELQQRRIVDIKHRIFAHPTPLGERLIAILSGQEAAAVTIPKLPEPPA